MCEDSRAARGRQEMQEKLLCQLQHCPFSYHWLRGGSKEASQPVKAVWKDFSQRWTTASENRSNKSTKAGHRARQCTVIGAGSQGQFTRHFIKVAMTAVYWLYMSYVRRP